MKLIHLLKFFHKILPSKTWKQPFYFIPTQPSLDPSFRKGLGGIQTMGVVMTLNCASKFVWKSGMTARRELIYYKLHDSFTYNLTIIHATAAYEWALSKVFSVTMYRWNLLTKLFLVIIVFSGSIFWTTKFIITLQEMRLYHFAVFYCNFHCHIVLTTRKF